MDDSLAMLSLRNPVNGIVRGIVTAFGTEGSLGTIDTCEIVPQRTGTDRDSLRIQPQSQLRRRMTFGAQFLKDSAHLDNSLKGNTLSIRLNQGRTIAQP